MIPKEDDKKFSIPPKLDANYENFNLVTETASYLVFEALTRQIPQEKHSIRILDPTKDLVKNNFDSAATLFIQELFHLYSRFPGSVLINTLEISETRKQVACAVRDGGLVSLQLDEIQQLIDLNNPKQVEKLLNGVISDVEFLWRDLKMKNIASIVEPENIYFLREKGTFFLGNWNKITEENPARPQDLTSKRIASIESELRSQDIAAEIKALAFALLKMKKVDLEELTILESIKKIKTSTYEAAVKSAVEEGFNDSQKLKNLLERMLSHDPQKLPNLEEFKIKEVGIQVPIEEANFIPRYNSVITDSILTSTPPTLLAWCSYQKNKISIIDLETKQNYVTFDGAGISDTTRSWTHIKEIPNTKLLVSLHHNDGKSANIELFDISKKAKANKIYSLGEVSGVVGFGNVTYNSRRSLIGAIPVAGRIAYHLFNVDTNASNADGIVKLNRKSKWHSQYSTQQGNYITSFDFNPAGESIATTDYYGVCLISAVNTDNYALHLGVGNEDDYVGRCRWSTNTDEPLLFVKYDKKILNVLDVEKKALILSKPVELEKSDYVYWIDVCQSNGNLLASGGSDKTIKIVDKRESKIVKTFEGVHSKSIDCVRWNQSGDMIASGSDDCTAKLFDFKTGKILHTGTTPDGNWALSVCFI